ncbi:MAG TPA: thiamine pyrophosphate-dependent enzyme, partial [Rubrobacteraceae bacterium]|nr:thiamine pyrophosphate-dependent enzyme [Rubrobacteraceae bacterium]
ENISDRAAAYGMPGVTVSGAELDEVHDAAAEALERARAGEGPTLLEAITYRYLGHSKSDANLYRTREEIAMWRKQDPIQRFAVKLEDEGLLEEEEWRTLEEQSQGRIEEAFEKAQNQPDPKPESALEDVYA